MENEEFRLGCEMLLEAPPSWFRTGRLGLLANQASVDGTLRNVKDLIRTAGGRIECLFSPQHGYFSQKQANMIESADDRDSELDIPVVSLYAETRRPSLESLSAIDVLVIDLQDVGTRVYTYTTTMGMCMEAAARADIKVAVLDRPNPISGTKIEGNMLESAYKSFVGWYPVPMRHGLTPGEFARYIDRNASIGCDLEVVSMRGWRRSCYYDSLARPWVFPSPNMPSWETALLYPGMVLLEGTNISEGRGTTLPFHLFGAPFLNQKRILSHLRASGLEGVFFRPLVFEPAFDKYKGEPCFGFQMHVTDRDRFRPYRTCLALLEALWREHPGQFRWLDPPYEYETEKLPIDILLGSETVRRRIEDGEDLDRLETEWEDTLRDYREKCEHALLYPN